MSKGFFMNGRHFSIHHNACIGLAVLLVCVAVPLASCKRSPKKNQSSLLSMIDQKDVVYLEGNLPIIITVPHGGTASPGAIPDRNPLCLGGISTGNDVATIDLAYDIVEAIKNISHGKSPHVIINNLSRSKIDQNRGWGEDCNPVKGRGGEAWTDFHERFTGSIAINAVLNTFGKGLYIDLHGKPDNYGAAVMLGYNLTSTDLRASDDTLNVPANGYAEKSSIRFLSMHVGDEIDFADLLRGNVSGHESFGSILQEGLDELNEGFTVVPRDNLKEPSPYLSGEYNIQAFCGVMNNRYGYTDSRFISGFQLEVCREIRDSDSLRKDFAQKVAEAVRTYLARHYHIEI